MVTQENSANSKSIQYHHEGELHELIITTRYDGNMIYEEGGAFIYGENAIDACDEITRATVRAWCQAWSALMHRVYDINYPSPCEGLGIAPSDSEPYCTVWNKNYNGLTLTVQSSRPPVYAVIAAQGQAQAIEAIHESVKNAGKDKPDEQSQDTPRSDANQSRSTDAISRDDDWPERKSASTNPHGIGRDYHKDGHHEIPSTDVSGKVELAAWKEAQVFGTAVNLPMAKKGEVRVAIKGSQLIADEKQYEDGDLIAFPLSKVFATTVGQNDIPVIKVITLGYGLITVWKFKKDGDKNYDYRSVIEAFEVIGIDATLDDFEVSSIDNAFVVIKAGHSRDGQKEFKNIYGFWRKPVGSDTSDKYPPATPLPSQTDYGDIPF